MPEITRIQINDSHAYLYEHPEASAGARGALLKRTFAADPFRQLGG